MTATVQQDLSLFRSGSPPAPSARQWLVDPGALARCRSLFSRCPSGVQAAETACETAIDVPPAYDSFCRTHFTSVRRMHPELDWNDARPAYAIALAAHVVLCEVLDEEDEQRLADHWDILRGRSSLNWAQARPLVADGCRALSRLDPLAMHR